MASTWSAATAPLDSDNVYVDGTNIYVAASRFAATKTFAPSTYTSSESTGAVAVTSSLRAVHHRLAVPIPAGRVTRRTPLSGDTVGHAERIEDGANGEEELPAWGDEHGHGDRRQARRRDVEQSLLVTRRDWSCGTSAGDAHTADRDRGEIERADGRGHALGLPSCVS